MTYPLVLNLMGGLGDTIYQRPLVRAVAAREGTVWVKTFWPQLLNDIPGVGCARSGGDLRCQQDNMARVPGLFGKPPVRAREVTPRYHLRERRMSIMQELELQLPLEGAELAMDLPDFGPPPARVRGRRYAVLRPATVRKEWANPARSASSYHLQDAAKWLRSAGYTVVSVASLAEGAEWIVDPVPVADVHWLHGELGVEDLVSLVRHAALVVGGVGFIVPMALATGTPLVCICGGQGGYNAPHRIVDPRTDHGMVRFLMPEPYCKCTDRLHPCPKRIPEFGAQFAGAVESVMQVAA